MKGERKKEDLLVSLSTDHLQGSEGMIHAKTIPYNQTRDHSTGGSHHSSDRGSSSTSGKANSYSVQWWILNEARQKSVLTLMFASHFSGSQNQKKGTRAPKIPKHNAVSWGESPPHANAWGCDEYSLPMDRRYGEKTHSCMHFYTAHTNTQTYIAPLAASVEVGSQKK